MMRKRLAFCVIFGAGLVFSPRVVQAVMVSFDLPALAVNLGDPVEVGIAVSGLGDLAPPSLSIFDLDVGFDPGILAFDTFTFGDPLLGDQLDLFALGSISMQTPGAGTLNLFELSLDLPSDLHSLQPGEFTLGTLSFDALSFGTSPLSLGVNDFGDAYGEPLQTNTRSGSVSVIPEPASLYLLGFGLLGLAASRRRAIG